jgi:hypothetical protein
MLPFVIMLSKSLKNKNKFFKENNEHRFLQLLQFLRKHFPKESYKEVKWGEKYFWVLILNKSECNAIAAITWGV